jgi:gamma-glutamyltranspeptidase
MADTDFVPLPGGSPAALLDKTYLRNRANLIDFTRSMGTAVAGTFTSAPLGISSAEGKGTTHMTIVDKQGNVVVMTTTIESGMGSYRMTNGFLLNNQLTDFSVLAADSNGPDRQPGAGQQAATQLHGADPGVQDGRRWLDGRFLDGHRLARRRDHHPVRDQDAGGRAGLGHGRAAGHLDG